MNLPPLSLSGLFAGLIFGAIGLWLFREGKRQLNFSFYLIGLALMVYPYFTTGPLLDWGVGFLLCFIAYLLR